MFDKLIYKFTIRKIEKERNKKRKLLIKKDYESELVVHHYCGCERGGLGLISVDITQLKNLKESLEGRGYKCTLFEDFYCGHRSFKFNLIPNYKRDKNLADTFNFFLSFVDNYFVNGKPVPNFDFFNEKEKGILNLWW